MKDLDFSLIQPSSKEELIVENERLRTENAYLKKIAGLEGSGASVKTKAVATLKETYRLKVLLEVADLARSTFYYHQARMDAPDKHAELKVLITKIFDASKARYGHRRIHLALQTQGIKIAKKTVSKLMKAQHLVCKTRSSKRYISYRGQVGKIAPNVLGRDFTATKPNQKWVTDVTEFRIGEDKLYLSPVMDLFDHSIIAFSTSQHPTVNFTVQALQKAIHTLGDNDTPIVHSDQGFQYQHHSWRNCLKKVAATQSMSRKGNCLDNAVIENFFSHLKEEAFHHDQYANINELETAIHDYIHWYNNTRISTKLHGMSPTQYRTRTLTT